MKNGNRKRRFPHFETITVRNIESGYSSRQIQKYRNPFIFDKFLALPEVFIYPRLLFPSDFLSVFKIDVVPIPKLFQRLRQISFFSLVHETNLLSSGFYLFNLSGLDNGFYFSARIHQTTYHKTVGSLKARIFSKVSIYKLQKKYFN